MYDAEKVFVCGIVCLCIILSMGVPVCQETSLQFALDLGGILDPDSWMNKKINELNALMALRMN